MGTWLHPRAGFVDIFDEEEFADVGVLSAHADPQAVFATLAEIRTAARRAFVYDDTGRRVAASRLRNMAPVRKDFAVGDIVRYRRGTDPIVWSPAGRIIGFDGGRTAWMLARTESDHARQKRPWRKYI